ncbi:tyrosine-type recombinase/integrase [Streptomyces sp. NPDC004685]
MLFADESGDSLHRGTIRNRLRRLTELEGRPAAEWFSLQALRRVGATHNYERGVDLVAIQQMLGHRTVSSTTRYVRPSATFIEDTYQRAVTSTLAELAGKDTTVCGWPPPSARCVPGPNCGGCWPRRPAGAVLGVCVRAGHQRVLTGEDDHVGCVVHGP